MPKCRTCGRYDQLTQRKEYQHDYYVRNKERIKKIESGESWLKSDLPCI